MNEAMLKAFQQAASKLDSASIPMDGRSAWMTRDTYISLGGTIESWDKIPGFGNMKCVRGDEYPTVMM